MEEKTFFIEIFQPFAQYRNPFTFYYAQTFPLPPKSTIIGMLQNAVCDWYGSKLGADEWWNLKVSIHGGFESVFWNYQQLIKGDLAFNREGILLNKHKNNPGGEIWLPLYAGELTAQRSPVYQQELFNGHLYIFIRGDEDLLGKIKVSLENLKKILYLGRSEDIVFIRKIPEEFIKPKKEDSVEGDIKLKYPTYMKLKDSEGREFPIKKRKFPVYSLPTKVVFENNGKPVSSKAEIIKNTERNPEFETVIYTGVDYSIILRDKVEIETFKIDDKTINILNHFGWL